ncbi:phosphotransferase [Novosphingobium colocasiae]
MVHLASPGGGGFGLPAEREPGAVIADLNAGIIDAATARDTYGVKGEVDRLVLDRPVYKRPPGRNWSDGEPCLGGRCRRTGVGGRADGLGGGQHRCAHRRVAPDFGRQPLSLVHPDHCGARPPQAAKRYYLRYQMPRPQTVEPYTVLREIRFYRLIENSGVPMARLIAVNPLFPAVLLEHIEGIAEFRRLKDRDERETIAFEFTDALARLHAVRAGLGDVPDAANRQTMADCARCEVAEWRAMYEEMPDREPLIEFGLQWLDANIPETDEAPVLVHGDAGPGNFLFDKGHLTALIDWEFAHLGDPHDDLAWFAMRVVMEPVPDFARCLRRYEERSGRTIDLARLRFYQVLVSTRVLIIRHRNVSGEYGNSIVSQALNRRLLTTALALANHIELPPVPVPPPVETDATAMFDFLVASLRDDIVAKKH